MRTELRTNLLLLGAMILVVVGLVAINARAQDNAGATAADRPAARAAARAGGAERPKAGLEREAVVKRLMDELQLTAEQAPKVKQVLESYRQSMENWAKEHAQEAKDARQKMVDARAGGKQEDVKAAREAMAKLEAGRKELADNTRKQLAEVPLTAEQMAKVDRFLDPGRAGAPATRLAAILSRLNLTDDQKEKVARIQEETKAAVEKADGPKAKAEAMRAALEKIRKDILTDEQRKALAELEKAGPGAGEGLPPMLAAVKGLSDEQKTKIKDIWAEALKNAASADNKRQVMREALDKIANDVLTAGQKEELKKAMGAGAAGGGARARQKTQD